MILHPVLGVRTSPESPWVVKNRTKTFSSCSHQPPTKRSRTTTRGSTTNFEGSTPLVYQRSPTCTRGPPSDRVRIVDKVKVELGLGAGLEGCESCIDGV